MAKELRSAPTALKPSIRSDLRTYSPLFKEPLPKLELSPDKLSSAEEKAFDLLRVERDKAAIDMDDFRGVKDYSEERIQIDKKRVEGIKTKIQKRGTEPTRKARLLEMVLTDQIELSNWFGQDTHTIVPAEYDDIFNGVDIALETVDESGAKHLALGIDATSSTMKIREKLKKIKEHIADGTLTKLEYFHSDDYDPEYYGAKGNIPSVVIGTSGKTIRELGELWMSAYGLARLRQQSGGAPLSPESEESQRQAVKEAKSKLANHRAQFLFLEEIKMQLAVFRDFAVRIGQPIVAQKFIYILEIVDSVLEEKGTPNREDVFNNSEDLVFQGLRDALEDFDNL